MSNGPVAWLASPSEERTQFRLYFLDEGLKTGVLLVGAAPYIQALGHGGPDFQRGLVTTFTLSMQLLEG